ncbi:hypothetical protein [Streptomyces sp. NPDC006463]|uniref:hypothetical protein n=1 Tax=Streptomyces sp. NPDC006463 TaxID=3364746 RepID=UPI0036A09567
MALLDSEGPIALVVCERTGPGLDEVALFEEIRRSPGHGRVPILALEAGVDDCLAKPFHPKEFLTRVGRLARPAV